MGLPTSFIEPLRAALESQGFSRASISDTGEVQPLALISGVYQTMEIRTGVSPPVVIDLRTAGANSKSPPSAVGKFLQPTLILQGTKPSNRAVLAPYGEAPPWKGTAIAVLIVGGIFVAGFMVGRSKG